MKKNAVKWSVNPKTHSSPRQLHHRCRGLKPQSLANRAASARRGSGSATAALGTKTWEALKDIGCPPYSLLRLATATLSRILGANNFSSFNGNHAGPPCPGAVIPKYLPL